MSSLIKNYCNFIFLFSCWEKFNRPFLKIAYFSEKRQKPSEYVVIRKMLWYNFLQINQLVMYHGMEELLRALLKL